MANLPADMAADVGKARVAGGGSYITHGSYTMLVRKWHYERLQDRVIILELLVIEAKKNIVREGDKVIDQEPNAAGSDCSTVANFDGDGKLSAPANSRAPMLALFDLKDTEVADAKAAETMIFVCSDVQPATGMLIACSTFPKEIRSRKGSYITGVSWSCVNKPGEGVNAAEAVAARVAALKQTPEACVALAVDQLAKARAAGTLAAPTAPSTNGAQAAPPVVPPAPPAASSAPPVPPAPPVDPMGGWTQHPSNPTYWFREDQTKKRAYTKDQILAGQATE